MADWTRVAVSPSTLLGDAIARIDSTGSQVALVLTDDGRLAGVLTDGDIRRAILRGQSLQTPTGEVMNSRPTSVSVDTTREEMLALMRRQLFHHLPVVNDAGRVVGLVTLDELIGAVERPNWVVLMAGGLGSRLYPLTEDCPKPLLMVGGKPILEIILESLSEQGFKHIFLSVNYKAEMIKNYFGTGERWGVNVKYIHEDRRLGTAGALSLLPHTPSTPLIVMNGDLLTRTNFDSFIKFHAEHNSIASMAVREYDFQVPYGVVRLEGQRITAIEEKPVQRFFVNAGIYVLAPEALEYLPVNNYFDMPSLFDRIIEAGKTTAAYPLREYWLDIGRLEEFERAQKEWTGVAGDRR